MKCSEIAFAVLAACAVVASFPRAASAQSGETVTPYIVFIMDVSGSMNDPVTGPPESCSGDTGRIEHAKCALQKIVNAYGDVSIALGKFRQTTTDTDCSNGCSMSGPCQSPGESPDSLELLVPIVSGNQYDVLEWVNFTCGTCFPDQANDPELRGSGFTPLAGSLNGAQRYFEGNDPDWMSLPGGDPIGDDPLSSVFVGPGEQCRPYIVILLTDGNETCAASADTVTAAQNLLVTTYAFDTYRVETKPIGFGMTPCDADIEAIAHAGGAPDDGDPMTCEGFYAANENDLAVAISQIIADSLKFESCNGADDDCDGLVDEDFPSLGATCDDGLLGICRGTGVNQCLADGSGTVCNITNPGQSPGVEICNGVDDNCNGIIDEPPADCTLCNETEVCDNIDNDCDGQVDEDLERPCGNDVGECTSGTETCFMGMWVGCDGTGPFIEVCDGLDNNCDGTIDGFAEACTDLPDPPGNPNIGICQPGIRVCPADGSGMFGPCLGEIVPQPLDLCDGLDNDCDGPVDEDHVPADCSSACGIGVTVCNLGVIECMGSSMPEPEVCDGLDNDCDGVVDEGVPDMGACDENGTLCVPGLMVCLGGGYMCVGGEPPGMEICDCLDNDCDTLIDEDPDLCAPGQSCVDCQCASPCAGGEFPCPVGQVCIDQFCLADPCFGVTCAPDTNGDERQCCENGDNGCVPGECVRSCDLATCPVGFVCRGSDGNCYPDTCTAFPDKCAADERCVGGVCELDPCFAIECPAIDEYCYEGDCVASCAGVECATDERCVLGQCEPHPCGGECPGDQVCNESSGQCQADLCGTTVCPPGMVCDPASGQCGDDPCVGVTCPGVDEVCRGGSCYEPGQGSPDAGVDDTYVSPGGGGGCSASRDATGSLAFLLLASMFAAGRRRREDR